MSQRSKTSKGVNFTPLISGGIEYKSGTQTQVIDPERVSLAFNISYKDPTIQSCIGLISRYLFADGIEITKNNEPLDTKKDFQEYISMYFQRFGEDCIRWILCAGVVPVTFCYVEETKEWIPVAAKPFSGDIWSSYSNHRQRFTFHDKTINQNNRVIVMSGFGYDPTINGELTSLVNSLIATRLSSSVMMDCATVAERIRSNPAFVLQRRKDVTHSTPRLGVDWGFYSEYDTADEKNESHMWHRTQRDIDHLKSLNSTIYDMYYNTGAPNQFDLGPNGEMLPTKPWVKNEYYLPESMELTNQPLPQVRSDLIAIMQFTNTEIYNTLGVPENMFNGTVSRAGSAEAVNETFKKTILWWKRTIASLLTSCYNLIYGPYDATYVLDTYFNISKTNPKDLNEDHIYALQKDNKIVVNLPIPPFITNSELQSFYQQGALTPEEFINYQRRSANIPPIEKIDYVPPRGDEQEENTNKSTSTTKTTEKKDKDSTKRERPKEKEEKKEKSKKQKTDE